jgi:hypothetical protein
VVTADRKLVELLKRHTVDPAEEPGIGDLHIYTAAGNAVMGATLPLGYDACQSGEARPGKPVS